MRDAAPLEPILDPSLPIIDPHHHLWDRTTSPPTPVSHPFDNVARLRPRYLLNELLADMSGGHNIVASVYLQCGSFYRSDGPAALRCVGETEFANGVAAMAASGAYGEIRACAGIVGYADLSLGDDVAEVLDAHIAAGGGRFRGVRRIGSYDPDPDVLGSLMRIDGGLFRSDRFRAGFARLAPLGLSFDAWLLEPQIPDLIDLARAFPETPIVLDHVGTPLGIASYTGRRGERFGIWRDNIRELARAPNVHVKLGGLAMAYPGFASFMADPPASSSQLAAEWKPYIETCIEAFGPERSMFESNFPVDICGCSYNVLWNAFKLLAADYSPDDKAALFSATANKFYRLGVETDRSAPA